MAEPPDGVLVGRRHGAQDADLGLQHHLGRGHAGHQRDLGVPVLDLQRRPEVEPVVALVVLVDLLLGHRQARSAPAALELDPLQPDLLEQQEPLVGRAVVDGLLHPLVVQPVGAAHHRPVDHDLGALAVGLERHVPDERRAGLAGEQAGRVLTQHRWVERRALVGGVDGLPAAAGLGVDGSPGPDEGRHVGDGVADAVAVTGALDVQRLVEVHRPGRVDGEERQRRSRRARAGREPRRQPSPRTPPRAGRPPGPSARPGWRRTSPPAQRTARRSVSRVGSWTWMLRLGMTPTYPAPGAGEPSADRRPAGT